MDMKEAWRELSWGRRAAVLFLLPFVLTVAVVALAAFLLLVSIWNIFAAAYCLIRVVVIGKRPPPMTTPLDHYDD
jgi:hypothetical protein